MNSVRDIDNTSFRWVLISRTLLATLFIIGAVILKVSGTDDALTFSLVPIFLYAFTIYASTLGIVILARIPVSKLSIGSSYSLSTFDLLLVSWLVTYTGGSTSPFIFLYLFLIIGASLLRLRRGALVMTAASMVMLGGIFLLEFYKHLPITYSLRIHRASTSELLVTAFYNISAFYVVGILSSYLAERLRTTGLELSQRDLDISLLKGLQERIIDNVASGLMTLDEHERVLLVNRQAERILGVAASNILGLPIRDVIPGILLGGRDSDGRLELRYSQPRGQFLALGYSVSNISIDVDRVGSVVLFQDLTRMKEQELVAKRQEKLAALGSMAAGIAHEIRNPLGAISGSLQLLRQQNSQAAGDEKALLDIALREIDRLNLLVSDFLLYAKPGRKNVERVYPGRVAGEVYAELCHAKTWPAGVRVHIEEMPDLAIDAEEGPIRQILLNLILNAVQAGAREIIVRGHRDGARAIVEIQDNGPGISHEAMAHLFEPFYTTRADGVGLGLAIVYRVVEEYQGSIEVESKPGATLFRLQFPVTHQAL